MTYACDYLCASDRDRLSSDLHLCLFLSGPRNRNDHTVIGTVETPVRIWNIDRILVVIQFL